MVVLFIDTCNRMLAVGLEKDGKLIYKKEYDAFKKQSELLAKAKVQQQDSTNPLDQKVENPLDKVEDNNPFKNEGSNNE